MSDIRVSDLRRRLHELDGCAIRVANVDNALSGVRARFERLRFAGGFPTGRGDHVQHCVEVIHGECNVDRTNIARFKIDMFSGGRCEILEQFDLMSVTFQNRDRDFSAGHSGDFAGEIAGMMRAMGQLKAENIAPESERALEIRHGDTGVIRCHDVKWCLAHVLFPICLNGLFRRRILRRGRGDEFLEARIIPERIEHRIEPEQRGSERHVLRSQRASIGYRE